MAVNMGIIALILTIIAWLEWELENIKKKMIKVYAIHEVNGRSEINHFLF